MVYIDASTAPADSSGPNWVDVDSTFEGFDSAEDMFAWMVSTYGVESGRVVVEQGPGGGNPIVRYVGGREQLKALLLGSYNPYGQDDPRFDLSDYFPDEVVPALQQQ